MNRGYDMNDLNVKKIGIAVLLLALVLPSVGVVANAVAFALQLGILKLVS